MARKYYIFWLLIQLVLVLWVWLGASLRNPPIALAGCADQCGEVLIPYPFGLRTATPNQTCFYNASYEIVCNESFHPPRPFLPKFNLEVVDITWNGRWFGNYLYYDNFNYCNQTLTVRTIPQNVCASGGSVSINLTGSPYQFSQEDNNLVVKGCRGTVSLANSSGDSLVDCVTSCSNQQTNNNHDHWNSSTTCKNHVGYNGCCQASFPVDSTTYQNLDFYRISVVDQTPSIDKNNSNSAACNMIASLVEVRHLDQNQFSGRLSSNEPVNTVLLWNGIPSGPFTECWQAATNILSCSCRDYEGSGGNPYLPYNGCISDTGSSAYLYQNTQQNSLKRGLVLGSSIVVGFVLVIKLLCSYWLYKVIKRRREIKRRTKFFKRNGGLLLEQHISSREGFIEKTKIFSVTELEKATDNFNKNRILGQGGQGTVYKGMMEDGKLVAVKKSKKIDENQLEQFINELVILSQIDHRNVVKVLGCCLETEVPLLVYELIPNGTLYQLIHDPSEDFQMTWKIRLQIAAESADALAYLHSSSSSPIYHRDIKTTNILLDDKYRARVSDFGTSKAINIDQTHVTTCVQGTYGYLDPEYFQSNQFTEKSDVYSFGVVLVELITGKKPICPTENGGWISLASEFLFHMGSGSLDEILDNRVFEEGKRDEFMAVANLARQCLKSNGKRRPTMKEVSKVLDETWSKHRHHLAQTSHLETDDMDHSHLSGTLSLPDNHNMTNCFSIDVQPLIGNTV